MSFLSRLRGNVVRLPAGGAGRAGDARDQRGVVPGRDRRRSIALGERADARAKLNDLVKALLDAETGQRGYLLTERREYLRPVRAGAARRRATLLAWLDALLREATPKAAPTMARGREGDRGQAERAGDDDRAARPRRRRTSWRELMLSDIGREKMEHVRALGERAARARERRRSRSAGASVYETLWLNRIGVSAMAALSLLALFMYLRQTATLDRALARRGRSAWPASATASSARSRRAPPS